jgi:hypothetical protein
MDKNKNEFEVILQAHSQYEQLPLPGQIVISQNNNWNDFGYKINCEYILCLHDGVTRLEGKLLLAFLPLKNLNSSQKEIDIESTDWPTLCKLFMDKDTESLIQFFCLLPNMQEYREVVTRLGIEHSLMFLNAINDLVFNNNKSKKEPWLKSALASEPFEMAFMRHSEQFFAFHNADTILQGIEHENYSAISQNLSLKFKLDGFGNAHSVHLKFDNSSILPKRINILIGKNGLGKSQSLQKFCRAALAVFFKVVGTVYPNIIKLHFAVHYLYFLSPDSMILVLLVGNS